MSYNYILKNIEIIYKKISKFNIYISNKKVLYFITINLLN